MRMKEGKEPKREEQAEGKTEPKNESSPFTKADAKSARKAGVSRSSIVKALRDPTCSCGG